MTVHTHSEHWTNNCNFPNFLLNCFRLYNVIDNFQYYTYVSRIWAKLLVPSKQNLGSSKRMQYIKFRWKKKKMSGTPKLWFCLNRELCTPLDKPGIKLYFLFSCTKLSGSRWNIANENEETRASKRFKYFTRLSMNNAINTLNRMKSAAHNK